MYGCQKLHPYIRAIYTSDRYALPVNTGRKYGPYVRVSKTHLCVRAVNTARTHGPYLRVVRIGLNAENLVKIDLLGSEISLLQTIVKKNDEEENERK